DALKQEGDTRDLIRTVQRLRKEAGLSFTDRITLQIQGADEILKQYGELIEQETHSSLGSAGGDDHTMELGDRKVTIRFARKQ
ncbi:MAG TPA: DUF5915 domain-containing protein, partial [Candidatus Peribacteraceae bacterium]|nr:DUF5915 domain-containing protein [Candidatus Peribacteraceae bacterium]